MAMFNREDEGNRVAETVIGPSVKVEGNFVGSGNVVVEGVVNGTLKTAKDLRVGDAAKIKADVDAANAVVAGEIHGNLNVSGRLELVSTGKVFGNVTAAVLVVAEGAIVNGKIVMMKTTEAASGSTNDKKRGS